MTEVVITGLGPVAPNGVGKVQFWNSLKSGESGIRRISRFEEQGYLPQIAGVVPADWLPDNDSANGARQRRLIASAAHLALEDAAISRDDFCKYASGIRVGVSMVDMAVGEQEYDCFKASGNARPYLLADSFPHAPATDIARELQCLGRVLTYSAACSSGLVSVISAAESIQRNEAELMLAGGGDAPLTPFMVSSFAAAGLHPPRFGNDPAAASRPFDAGREGGVLAEGAGMVVLESAERVRLRGANAYARIVGWGIANAASPKGLKTAYVSAMNQALQNARLSPDMIDYVSAHAPGIPISDVMEIEAIKDVFRDNAYNIPVTSIKSMIGNPLAASGALQVIAAAQVIEHKYIPPTTNYRCPDGRCDLDCVPNRGRVARVRNVLVNSSGFGGCVACVIMSSPERRAM